MHNKRLAFTMVELITACVILTGIAVFLVNTKMANQTAEREAARVLEWINKLTQTTNRTHQAFYFDFGEDNVKMKWSNSGTGTSWDKTLQATSGCKYALNKKGTGDLMYKTTQVFSPWCSFKITGTDESIYYIIFHSGRVRISPDPPKSEEEN